MSTIIWTPSALAPEVSALDARVTRLATVSAVPLSERLLSDRIESERLDALIDRRKRSASGSARGEAQDSAPNHAPIHPWIRASFHPPPLFSGTRFGSKLERGIWYGAAERRTALAEVAYHRLRFLEASSAELPEILTFHACFQATLRTARGLDLEREAFAKVLPRLASRTSYEHSQRFGRDARAAGIAAIRFPSARDRARGACFAVMDPQALASQVPTADPEGAAWACTTTPYEVRFRALAPAPAQCVVFPRGAFLIRGRLPDPLAHER